MIRSTRSRSQLDDEYEASPPFLTLPNTSRLYGHLVVIRYLFVALELKTLFSSSAQSGPGDGYFPQVYIEFSVQVVVFPIPIPGIIMPTSGHTYFIINKKSESSALDLSGADQKSIIGFGFHGGDNQKVRYTTHSDSSVS